ncbi:phage portal protein [Actinomyces culturomici]|uniref:phage portal protein n=1 Tax=Actinomyces culturomici TaxID=1926276 RepID=UPI000E203623|nr:phage portal protein [Actinomyces culturomici]
MITAPQFKELTSDEQSALNSLWWQLQSKAAKNNLLAQYYDGHRAFQDLGISIPPQMAGTRAALGWPQKVVGALARKHVFEGIALDGDLDPFGLSEVLTVNDFGSELAQAITSAYTHSCAFLTVLKGNEADGEPPVVIRARDARWTTALWDHQGRRIYAALIVTESTRESYSDEMDRLIARTMVVPTAMTMLLPKSTIVMKREGAAWSVVRIPNEWNRVMVEPIIYDPQLSRPFGRSRISREVRYLTDAAIRTMVRTETSAEFFSSPQRAVIGADEDAFDSVDRWSAIMGRLLSIGLNEEGQMPKVEQFPQMTMEPHLAMYRQLAQNLCSATNLPTSAVGIFADNPASAEAMQAAEYALSDEAEYQWRVFTPALRRIAEDVVMVRDGLSEPPAESWRLNVNWTPARYVSPQASSDFIVKTVQAIPKVAETTVALRRAGFTQGEIDQMNAEIRRSSASGVLDRLATEGAEPEGAALSEVTSGGGA